MRFNVAFKIGNRWGKYSRYSPREVCIHLTEAYSLRDREVVRIFTLAVGEEFINEDMKVMRVA